MKHQGDLGNEIKSSISHWAWWQTLTWDGCFCLLAKGERGAGASRRKCETWHHDLRMCPLWFWEESKDVQDSLGARNHKAKEEFLVEALQCVHISITFLVPNIQQWKDKTYNQKDMLRL